MFTKEVALMWFRRDLRLEDNPALFFALKSEYSVVPIYIIDEDDFSSEETMGESSKTWLQEALKNLNNDLNGRLQIFYGNREKIFSEIFSNLQVKALFYNKIYEPREILRDKNVATIAGSEVTISSFNGSLLVEPGAIKNVDGSFYKVFTPFYKRFYFDKAFDQPLPMPNNMVLSEEKLKTSFDFNFMDLVNSNTNNSISMWNVGECAAKKILETFIKKHLIDYEKNRDLPSIYGTSRLGPYLHFGHISSRYVFHALQKNFMRESFLRQLVWREFAYHTLYHKTNMLHECINLKYEKFPWTYSDALFNAWRDGATGYPIIDAGMRELIQTGYMHNRVRMIVASFLVKNLNIHWTFGERYFREKLFDADIANNSFGWQWVAGCGSDAAPYFRIFNPTLQAQKFDCNGDYIRRFVPELADLPIKYLFEPWKACQDILEQFGVFLGKNYPSPIVDFKESRIKALDLYKNFY